MPPKKNHDDDADDASSRFNDEASNSSSDEDEDSTEHDEKIARSILRQHDRRKRTKLESDQEPDARRSGNARVTNALLKSIQRNRFATVDMAAAAFVRTLCGDKAESDPHLAWFKQVGPTLADTMKADLVLTALLQGNAPTALRVLGWVGFPVFVRNQFIIRYLWSALGNFHTALRDLVDLMATDAALQQQFGARHVLLRLMSNRNTGTSNDYLDLAVWQIEGLQSQVLLGRLRSTQDVADLLALGWRPTIATLFEHLHTSNPDSLVRRLAPTVWADLSTTLSLWIDSPHHAPSSGWDVDVWPRGYVMATVLDPTSSFWRHDGMSHWIDSFEQLRLHAPSLAEPRPRKLPLMPPLDLQRMLALIHKSPTLLRLAWAKQSLTWLSYILLFKTRHFHTMLQLLLQPPSPRAPCFCPLQRLSNMSAYRKQLAKHPRAQPRHGLVTCQPQGHTRFCVDHGSCCTGHQLLHAGQCAPWYRPPAPGTEDPDVWDQLYVILDQPKLLRSPFSLNRLGRTVAIAHFCAVFASKNVTATAILILGEIAAHWPVTPPIKEFRALLTLVHQLVDAMAAMGAATSAATSATTAAGPVVASSAGNGGSSGGGGGSAEPVTAATATVAPVTGIETHPLYQKPGKDSLSWRLRKLHYQLAALTSSSTGSDRRVPSMGSLPVLSNVPCQLLRQVYQSTYTLFFDY